MRFQTGIASRRGARRGFTLIELMVVVVIIAILIGILIPAVGAVKRSARNTQTQAILGTLGTGLESFRAEQKIGGGYPPSYSDAVIGSGDQGKVRSPYTALGGPQWFDITGAGLLVWALLGADQLGTPGFQPFRTNNNERLWYRDSDATNTGNDPTASGAYALRSDDQRPLHPRYGPYVDASKVQVTQWDRQQSKFVIPAEAEANPNSNPSRDYPLLLDGFGFPILYWRADTAGVQIADADRFNASGSNRGIYHWEDNMELIRDNGSNRLVLRPGADDHSLDFNNTSPTWYQGYDPVNNLPDDAVSFVRFIMNMGVKARLTPHRADSYLLVSPGDDGVYGTGDDIANFEHNGR